MLLEYAPTDPQKLRNRLTSAIIYILKDFYPATKLEKLDRRPL